MKCQNKTGAIGGNSHLSTLERANGAFIAAYQYSMMIGDNSSETARQHYEIVKDMSCTKIFWGGQYFADFLPVSGGWLFWDKRTGNNDFSDGELAWCSKGKRVRKYEHLWNGTCRKGSRRLNPFPKIHPTQKPVELHIKILEDFSSPGDVILDCFGGSGTTLIACEVSKRICLCMELSPEYCEAIIKRYDELKSYDPWGDSKVVKINET